MIRHIWSVYCSKASFDKETNNVSLFEIIEQLDLTPTQTVTFPQNVPFEGQVVTLWARSDPATPVQGEMRLRLLGPAPAAHELGSLTGPIELTTAARTRQLTRIQGIKVEGPGWHEWEVSYRIAAADPWIRVALVPVEIRINPPAPTH